MKNKWHLSVLLLASFMALLLLSSVTTAGTQKAAQAAISENYSYDNAGRLTRVNYGDGSSIEYSYDANGSILSVTVMGGETVFQDGFE